jgi:hypothetical protein
MGNLLLTFTRNGTVKTGHFEALEQSSTSPLFFGRAEFISHLGRGRLRDGQENLLPVDAQTRKGIVPVWLFVKLNSIGKLVLLF